MSEQGCNDISGLQLTGAHSNLTQVFWRPLLVRGASYRRQRFRDRVHHGILLQRLRSWALDGTWFKSGWTLMQEEHWTSKAKEWCTSTDHV